MRTIAAIREKTDIRSKKNINKQKLIIKKE